MVDERAGAGATTRCARCGAVVYEGAAWCGLCFAPIEEAVPRPQQPSALEAGTVPPATTGPVPSPVPSEEGAGVGANAARWPCAVCEGRNPIEADVCSTCGTPFASLMRSDESRPSVEPMKALTWSLAYPGLGHARAGRGLDGVARGVLFTMLLVVVILILLSGATTAPVIAMQGLFGMCAVSVYLFSAAEAYRIAEGRGPLVPSKVLLWGTVALLFTSILVLSLVIGTAARR